MEDPTFSTLTSERLVVRRFEAADARALAAYRGDAAVARYQAWEMPYSLGQAEAFIDDLRDLSPGRPGTWFQFAVGHLTDGVLIGDVALRTTRSDPRQAELGFTFASAHQGRGHATEAVGCVLDYAFDRLALHRIFALTDARNRRAQRLLDRLGFRREGELRESSWLRGEWVDEIIHARLASESPVRHDRGGGRP